MRGYEFHPPHMINVATRLKRVTINKKNFWYDKSNSKSHVVIWIVNSAIPICDEINYDTDSKVIRNIS